MNQLSGRDLWLCRQRKRQRDLFAPKQKYKENKHSVSSPQLHRVVRFLPPPLWELLLKQTATGQDVATLSFLYLRPTLQMAYHNKCMSAVQDILRVSRPLADCEVVYERDGEKRLARHAQMQEERGKKHKKIQVYLMLVLLCSTCGGKQWSKAFHHLMLPEYKTLFSLQLGQNTQGRGGKEG